MMDPLSVVLTLALLTQVVAVVWVWIKSSNREHQRGKSEESRRRAERLLSSLLTDEEQKFLRTHGHLDVPSPSCPERTYRIFRGGGPVQVREDDRASVLLCVQPQTYLPQADVVLMHKLLIEGSERDYLKTANVVGWRDRDWINRLRA